MRLLIDLHLDLSWNALAFDRDQRKTIAQLRAAEAGMDQADRGGNTVCFPELRRARAAVCLATVLARSGPMQRQTISLTREEIDYTDPSIAYAVARGQAAYYEQMQRQGHLQKITTRAEFDAHWNHWQQENLSRKKLGYILSMEGADPIVHLDEVTHWWELGLRAVSLAHYGQGVYAMGTGGDGPLTQAGEQLVKQLDEVGMMLDLSHTADEAFAQITEMYSSPVFVSHGNCRALLDNDRQISDEQIQSIAQRGGIVGVVLYTGMLKPKGQIASLSDVADHIDHLCQLTGSSDHAAIGSDLDGGFGTECSPSDLDTIYDIHKLEEVLANRGYIAEDIDNVFFGNAARFLRQSLPV